MAKAQESHLRVYKSYSKRMSDHVAIALVVYTLEHRAFNLQHSHRA